ncbi:MAG: hypothetical protein ACI8ZM_004163 [Crocinitomix sp.]|jgi:hypothetical protein
MKKVIVLSILFTTMLSFKANAQEEVQTKVYFVEMEDNAYVFVDEFEESITFTQCEKAILQEYDLTDEEEIGQYFKVTYIFLDENEDERKIIKLSYAETEVEEEDWD